CRPASGSARPSAPAQATRPGRTVFGRRADVAAVAAVQHRQRAEDRSRRLHQRLRCAGPHLEHRRQRDLHRDRVLRGLACPRTVLGSRSFDDGSRYPLHTEPGRRAGGARRVMLTRFIRNQLIVFAALTLAALIALGWFYLRIPSQLGVGQYRLVAELPASGGLYRTSNVTYRGVQIGKVTKVEPTEHGVRATLSIDDRYKIPIDASADVHSVSAIGEQYVDLVSTGDSGKFFSPGQTITKGTVPSEIGPALDAANRGLSVLPKHKIASLLDETSLAVGGLGPALQRLVDSTQSIVGDFEANLSDVDDIIANAAPILDSQVDSGDSIAQWSRNLKVLTAQIANNDPHLQSLLSKGAPTAEQVDSVFSDVRESLPATIANLEVVADMLKRYNAGLEQLLVFLPEVGSVAQTLIASAPGAVLMNLNLSLNNPPPCLTGFLPASQWRSPADTSPAPLPSGTYCKIPQDTQAN